MVRTASTPSFKATPFLGMRWDIKLNTKHRSADSANMSNARNWFNTVRKKFIKSSHQRDIAILHSGNLSQHPMIKEARDFPNVSASSRSSFQTKHLTREDIAAIKIQSIFRGHLARRAYRALRSLVKLQAVARGAYVRKQAQIAMNCLHALVKLQVRVRARQLLGSYGE